MTPIEEILEFIEDEINLFRDIEPPLRYRILCWICRIHPRNKSIVDELEFIYQYISHTRPHKQNRGRLLELIARMEHEQWLDWSRSIAENECLSPARMKRWQGQLWKPYDELTEDQKEQDRVYARKILAVLND